MLVKNRRFKRGGAVDIHYAPIFTTTTISMTTSVAGNKFRINAEIEENATIEMFNVGDLAGFKFGAGVIISISEHNIIVEFPDSTFPVTNVKEYVGSDFQEIAIFLKNERVLRNVLTGNVKEKIDTATYGYAETVYSSESNTELSLLPSKFEDDAVLGQIAHSYAYILKSCDDDNYQVDQNAWQGDFPIELGGNSVDPVYRRAVLKERTLTTKRGVTRQEFIFKLLG